MSIFENGFLKNQYLNDRYRGLVGWTFSYTDSQSYTLFSNEYGTCQTTEDITGSVCLEDVYIKEFTQDDIPEGELVWLGYICKDISVEDDSVQWELLPKDSESNFFKSADLCVPYLIAENERIAEELCDWDKL